MTKDVFSAGCLPFNSPAVVAWSHSGDVEQRGPCGAERRQQGSIGQISELGAVRGVGQKEEALGGHFLGREIEEGPAAGLLRVVCVDLRSGRN